MYGIQRTRHEYFEGVQQFIRKATKHMRLKNKISIQCPCFDCQNVIMQRDMDKIMEHLIIRGFMKNYTRWVLHGEQRESSLDVGTSINAIERDDFDSEDEDCDVGNENNDVEEENYDAQDGNIETNVDNLDELINDIPTDFASEIPEIFQQLSNESDVKLYPGCEEFTKLDVVFDLYKLKAQNNWSDKSFTELLQLLKKILPENNELPDSTYKAKKLLCPMSMEFQKIHACPNDYILFRKEYKDDDKCPKCHASRYKQRDDQIEEEGKNRPAAKILWYLPIIPRIKRLFGNPKDAKLLRWHKEDRRIDSRIRHPADSPEWRNIDKEFEDFGNDPRNLRMGLSTDGMNQYGIMSTGRTTWPVLLILYNLPSWLCMKRKYMIMPLLISNPKQPGNDIDVYLAPLIDDLSEL